MMANALAKLGETDEALELISEFEEDTDTDVVRTIGFILSKAGLHELALAHYQKHISEDNNELLCLAGVSALRSGDIDQATVYLMTCAGSLSKYRLKSINTYGYSEITCLNTIVVSASLSALDSHYRRFRRRLDG